jgi:hypothetical protein
VKDLKTYRVLQEIIDSFSAGVDRLDRFVKHALKPKAYLRYGDDFIMVELDFQRLNVFRAQTIGFLKNRLKLTINPRSDKILKASQGLKFLGVMLWPHGRTLNKRIIKRIQTRLNERNAASYLGLIMQNGSRKWKKQFSWLIQEML